jgi:Zn-dependent M28 family amino/carboxypeptidase
VEAPIYYLPSDDKYSISQCKGKIVLIDGLMGHWKYQDLYEAGMAGFITYTGNANYADEEIDIKELRSYVSQGKKVPGVNINVKTAIKLVENDCKMAQIRLEQEEYKGASRNVVVNLPGEVEEYIVLTAHYDSVALSQGAYDNMSGSIGILAMAEYFSTHPHHYGIRIIWCGSEERGLLGSKAYVSAHEEELKQVVFNVNLDMIGCTMGKFIAVCTAEEKLVSYLKYFGDMEGFPIAAKQEVYSSDSTPFADKGIPAMSFARIAPSNTATIHNSYDTMKVMKMEHMEQDIAIITKFVDTMANAKRIPIERMIPDNMKEKLDIYLCRKRDDKK